MFSTSTIVITLLVVGICYLIISTIWSVFFGGLSQIPGPRLAAATRLVRLKHELYGNGETWRYELHQIYGDVVRITPEEVSFAGASAWKDIYGYAPGSQFAILPKDEAFFASNKEPARNLTIADDLNHARQRKCFNPAFGEKALRAQEPLVQRYISLLLHNIKTTTEDPHERGIDIERQYNYTTFDIMAELMFGESLKCLERSTYHPWIQLIWDVIEMQVIVNELERLPWLKAIIMMFVPMSFKTRVKQHKRFAIDCVDKRLSKQTSRDDVWKYVLAAESKNLRLTRDEMHSNAQVFMVAGSETGATALSGLTYFLLKNPEMMKLLTSEIRQRFDSPEKITVVETLSLTYLTACIQETFRMRPSVPIGIPRMTPKGGAEVCGHKLPENTLIYVHPQSTYRNPQNFIHPHTFLPQRWLAPDDNVGGKLKFDPAEFQQDKKHALQPFGLGPRNCIGQPLAWIEIRLIITQVLWHFDLELCEESREWGSFYSPIYRLWQHKPLMVRATSVVR